MFDVVVAFILGALASPWLFGFVLFFSLIINDADAPVGKALFSIFLIISGYFLCDVTLAEFAWTSIVGILFGYFGIGILFSFYRYRSFLEDRIEYYGSMYGYDKKKIRERLHPKQHYGKITNWVVFWPTCSFFFLLGDAWNSMKKFVSTMFGKVYEKIFVSVVGEDQEPTETIK